MTDDAKAAYRAEYYQKNKAKLREQQREYYKQNKRAISKRGADWYADNKDKVKCTVLSRTYGITLEERDAMILEQDSRCAICTTELTTPCVDHCHTTGEVRGILCHNCNLFLGNAKDNVTTLENAITYLKRNKL